MRAPTSRRPTCREPAVPDRIPPGRTKPARKARFSFAAFYCSSGCFSQTRTSFVRHVFQKIAGLAVETAADRVERREAHSLHLARLQQRQIGFGDANGFGQFIGADLAL